MFFILTCVNLVAYIASAYLFYAGDMLKGGIALGFGLLVSMGIVVLYNERKHKHNGKSGKKSNRWDCLDVIDCGDCGGLDCNCSP